MTPGSAFSVLELVPRIRQGEKTAAFALKTERHFFDFVVDGVSLHDSLCRELDLASVLWIDPPASFDVEKPVRRLLLIDPGDAPDGRVSLYVCPECGDLSCGAITADIRSSGDEIIWSRFGYQNDYDGLLDTDGYSLFGPFRFESAAYRAALLAAVPTARRQ